jgi:hypothetical protein
MLTPTWILADFSLNSDAQRVTSGWFGNQVLKLSSETYSAQVKADIPLPAQAESTQIKHMIDTEKSSSIPAAGAGYFVPALCNSNSSQVLCGSPFLNEPWTQGTIHGS